VGGFWVVSSGSSFAYGFGVLGSCSPRHGFIGRMFGDLWHRRPGACSPLVCPPFGFAQGSLVRSRLRRRPRSDIHASPRKRGSPRPRPPSMAASPATLARSLRRTQSRLTRPGRLAICTCSSLGGPGVDSATQGFATMPFLKVEQGDGSATQGFAPMRLKWIRLEETSDSRSYRSRRRSRGLPFPALQPRRMNRSRRI